MEQNSESVANVLITQFMSSFVMQIFLNGALSLLWNIFNTLQIIFSLNLLLVIFPANLAIYYDTLYAIVNFQIIPTDAIYGKVVSPILDLEFSED